MVGVGVMVGVFVAVGVGVLVAVGVLDGTQPKGVGVGVNVGPSENGVKVGCAPAFGKVWKVVL